MPWLAVLYFAFFCILSAAALWDDHRHQKPLWFIVCALISNLSVVYLFVAFWNRALLIPSGLVVSVIFIAALCWEIFSAVADFRMLQPDPELSTRERHLINIIVFILWLIVSLPALIVAGMAAFRL